MANGRPKPVLALDVYGTLIDPFRMEEHLRADFGAKAKEAAELWRTKQLEYSFRRALMKKYLNFGECTAQALRFTAAQLGVSLSAEAQANLLAQYPQLPPYPDARAALDELSAEGYALAAFSNGTESAVRKSLEHAGLLGYFGKIVSVDPLHTFKPDPVVYEALVVEMSAPRETVWVISSNPFDVIGAKACGLRAAWVQRDPKRIFDPWEFAADATVHSLAELKDVLVSQ